MATSREFGKNPTNHYKPGFIDTSTPEMMKMSLDRELGEISKALYQTDEVSNTKDNKVYKGSWNPKSGAYPNAGKENSWWDVITDNDAIVPFDGKDWKTFQKLEYLTETRTYQQVEDQGTQIIKERIREIAASSGGSNAAIKALEKIVIDGDTALATRIDTVETSYKSADTLIKASVTSEANARASGDSANSSKIDTVKAELSGNIASVKTTSDAALSKAGQMEAKWGVTVDVNGKVSGVSLNSGAASSDFSVRADRFSFSDTSGNKSYGFTSSGGVTTFTGSIAVADQGGNVGMKITNSQILVYDEQGRLRVKIGRL